MRKVRNLVIALLSVVCALCMFTACAKPSITLDKTTIALSCGETATITATLTDSEDAIKWSSSDETVVTVDQNGLVTAGVPGIATVTATAGEGKKQVSASCEITVTKAVIATPYTASKQYDLRATSISQSLESLGLAGYTGTVSVTSTGATVTGAEISGDNLVITATTTQAGNVDYVIELADKIITLRVTYYGLSVTLNKDAVALKVAVINDGDVVTDTLAYQASKAGGTIAYTLSEEGIVTISNDGVITSVAAGEVVITATYTLDGFTATDTVDVTVTRSELSDTATYSDKFVAISEGQAVIDLAKLNKDLSDATVSAVSVAGASATFTAEGTALNVAVAKGGEKQIVVTAVREATITEYTFDTILADFVLSDEASFKAWATAGHGTAGDKYAVVSQDITLTADVEINTAWFGGWTLNGLDHTVKNVYDYSGMFPGGTGGVTMKNITLNMKTCSSALGDDWYGTNNFTNVKINVSLPGHAGTSRLLFDRVRANTVFNFTDCEFTFNVDNALKTKDMLLMKLDNTGIVTNLVNTSITSNGYILKDAITACTLDETSSIVGLRKVISEATTYDAEYLAISEGKITIDTTKLGVDIDVAKVINVTVAGTDCAFEVDGDNLVVTNAKDGEIEIAVVIGGEDYDTAYKFNAIVATFVLSDEATFKAWLTAGHGTAGGKYAVVSQDITLTADQEVNTAWFGGWKLNGLNHTVSNIYDWSGMFPGGTGDVTMKNITLNIKTCSSALGDDWYNTNTFTNVKINVSIPGHASTSRLLFDRVRANTVFNFTDCEFKFTVDASKQENAMLLMKLDNSGIVTNLVNTKITSTGVISEDAISACTLDATSSIVGKKPTVAQEATYEDEYLLIAEGKVTLDLTKLSEDIVVEEISSVTVAGAAATYTVDGTNLVITTDKKGEVAIVISAESAKTFNNYTVNTILATHEISDAATFATMLAAAGYYAVVTQDITEEITGDWNRFQTGTVINGLGHTISSLKNDAGMYRSCLGDGVLKNITITVTTLHGALSDEIRAFTMDNVTMNIIVPANAAKTCILGNKTLAGTPSTIKNSTINVIVDDSRKDEAFVLVNTLNGEINFVNSTISSNGRMVMVGETYNGSAWGTGKVTLDETSKMVDAYEVATMEEGSEYADYADGKFTIDISKMTPAISIDDVNKVIMNGAACTITKEGTLLTVTCATVGAQALLIETDSALYAVEIGIVTNKISTPEQFKAYWTADHSNTYALLTDNIDMSTISGEVCAAASSNYVFDGNNKTVNAWYDSVGFCRAAQQDATWKNVKLTNIRSQSTIFGHSWTGTINLINVDVDAYFISGTTRALLTYDSHGLTFNMVDCDINITLDSSKLDTEYYLNSSWTSGTVFPVDTENTFVYTNCNITSSGLIGEHGSKYTFNNTTLTDKNDVAAE